MAPGQDHQLERLVDEALKSSSFQPLGLFLQNDLPGETTMKCSKRFITKLDKLVNMGFDNNDAKRTSLAFTILCKYAKSLVFPGGQRLSGIIAQGLVKKMRDWFEKCRQLWIQRGPQTDETLLKLAEDFFETLMVVYETSIEATYQITELFLHPIGQMAADPRIYIMIKKEAIQKFNIFLDKIPRELKKEKKILSSQESSDVMVKLAGQILNGGDYNFQTALVEGLCRMATHAQRRELVDRWFSMKYIASAFVKIRDSEFETDCRIFLNLVNAMQGDRRRVYSYPCFEVFLDQHELLMPSDEKLEEFWIDFNLGSQCISFYTATNEMTETDWDTICVTEKEVHSYTVTVKDKTQVLRVKLLQLLSVGVVEGSNLVIHFRSFLDIPQAARHVFGLSKNKSFVCKDSTSVVKTTVKIVMEDSSSQAVVPESQMSPIAQNKRERNTTPYWLVPLLASTQIVNPAKRRMSESTTFIASAHGSVHSASPNSVVIPANTPRGVKGKQALQMVRTRERQCHPSFGEMRALAKTSSRGTTQRAQCVPLDKAVEMVQAGPEGDPEPLEYRFVPDSQPGTKTERSILSNWHKVSVSEMLKMPIQRLKSLSRPEPKPSSGNQPEILQSPTHRVPGSGSTPHLQCAINKMAEDTESQELAGSQGKRPGSVSRIPKQPPPQRRGSRGSANWKKQDPKPLVAEPASVEAPLKPIPNKFLRVKTPNPKAQTVASISDKEKRDADSMVKQISSRYDGNDSGSKGVSKFHPPSWAPSLLNRSIFYKSWVPSGKKDVPQAVGLKKSNTKPRKHCNEHEDDIFAFSVDTPSNIGERHTESSAIVSSGARDSRSLPSMTKKGQVETKQGKQNVKKYLFSYTDGDNTKRDVSWLRQSGSKPKIITYSRKNPAKHKIPAPNTTDESPALPPPPPKSKENSRPIKKPCVQSGRAAAPSRRPQRATASTKSYKEPAEDSQSESEPVRKPSHADQQERKNEAAEGRKKKTDLQKKPTKTKWTLQSYRQSDTEILAAPKQTPDSVRKPRPCQLQHHVSGPSHGRSPPALSSDSEEEDEEEKMKRKRRKVKRMRQHSPKMKPRKFFKSFSKIERCEERSSSDHEQQTKESKAKDFGASMRGFKNVKSRSTSKASRDNVVQVSPGGRVNQVLSTSHMLSSRQHEVEMEDDEFDMEEDTDPPGVTMGGENMDSMCRKFGSKLQRKFQNNFRRMDLYTKQSLKTFQHHMSSLSTQVEEYRAQKLEKVQKVLLEEIKNMEQDDSTLKNMEKELSMFWRIQSTAFHSYREKETRSFETLKNALQNNTNYSLKYEERIFTSQMGLMRKDMKSVQDRLLKETQEEEIQGIRRGLQALFMPERGDVL